MENSVASIVSNDNDLVISKTYAKNKRYFFSFTREGIIPIIVFTTTRGGAAW